MLLWIWKAVDLMLNKVNIHIIWDVPILLKIKQNMFSEVWADKAANTRCIGCNQQHAIKKELKQFLWFTDDVNIIFL